MRRREPIVTLRPEDVAMIGGCLDTLGMMADLNHVWTAGEHAIYEESRILLGLPVNRTEDKGSDGWEGIAG